MAEEQRDPLVGKVLNGRFEIVAPLATGGMGKVYQAIQRPIDREVALKVLHPGFDGTMDPKFEERFFLEAITTAKLKHPNIVTLYDYGRTEDGLYFMALELLEGKTLQQLLVKDGPLPWPRALALGGQVARALREAHLHGVVHRDLKPGNIIVLPEGAAGDRVKLLDFGLVKGVTGPHPPPDEAPELTSASVVLGSPLYMAPEQAQKRVDPRSDVYSLGAVLFTTMAGRTPFLGKKPFELLLKHMHEKPPELDTFVDVPPAVNDVVMKCLAKAPEVRYQSMDALLTAMHHAVREQGISGLFVMPGLPPPVLKRAAPATGEPAQAAHPQPPLPPPLPAPRAIPAQPSLATPRDVRLRAPARERPGFWSRLRWSLSWVRLNGRALVVWTILGLTGTALGAAITAMSRGGGGRKVASADANTSSAAGLLRSPADPSSASPLKGDPTAGDTVPARAAPQERLDATPHRVDPTE